MSIHATNHTAAVSSKYKKAEINFLKKIKKNVILTSRLGNSALPPYGA